MAGGISWQGKLQRHSGDLLQLKMLCHHSQTEVKCQLPGPKSLLMEKFSDGLNFHLMMDDRDA
jgi:hypothetical protein